MAAALKYDSSFGRPQLCTSCIPQLGSVEEGRAGVVCHTSALSAWQQPVPSRLTTTPAGTTPPSGAHGASHTQCRPGDLPAFQLWQVKQDGRVLFYPQVLGPRLWWRALCQGPAMHCTSGPVITSELKPLYDQRNHTTL